MEWFKGSIPEAIGASRNKKSIFVVVVTGEDEDSKQLLSKLEEKDVSDVFSNFISILLKNGSSEAQQFSQLYPLVILPAIYFIGIQGSPLEIIGGLVDKPTLLTRAKGALNTHSAQLAVPQTLQAVEPPHQSLQTTVAATSGEASVHDTAVGGDEPAKEDDENESPLSLQARLEKADQLLAVVRKKKIEEEREKEKARELERREMGKQIQQLKEAQRERERRELAESRQKEKREEKDALDKIRQQIAQDREDRAARYQAAQVSEEERKRAAQNAQEQLAKERSSAARSAFARLQFRLPDGSTRLEQFSSDVKLKDVMDFINHQIQPPFSPYSVCVTFPRREFRETDMQSTLRDLDLSPSAALLIVPSGTTGSSDRTSASSISKSWLSKIFAPLFWVWTWVWTFISASPPQISQTPQNQPPTANQSTRTEKQPQPASQGVRRRRPESNIRRLNDVSPDDSSDDNATWNGNSTQQL